MRRAFLAATGILFLGGCAPRALQSGMAEETPASQVDLDAATGVAVQSSSESPEESPPVAEAAPEEPNPLLLDESPLTADDSPPEEKAPARMGKPALDGFSEGAKIQKVWIWQETGDCLSKMAKQYYGDAKLWPKIYEANRDKIKNPNVIFPKQVLVIPPLNPEAESSKAAPEGSVIDESAVDSAEPGAGNAEGAPGVGTAVEPGPEIPGLFQDDGAVQ